MEEPEPTRSATAGTKVLLVEDHDLVRFGMVSLLNDMGVAGLQVLEAGSLAQAVTVFEAQQHDTSLVILDLNLPDMRGLSALREFKSRFPRARVVVFSGSVDEMVAQEALAIGAERFLHKTSDVGQLRAALQECVRGAARGRPVHAGPEPASARHKRLTLSPREVEILDLLLQGCSNQEIVDATGLRLGTVKNYISGLLVTFGVGSRSKLATLFH